MSEKKKKKKKNLIISLINIASFDPWSTATKSYSCVLFVVPDCFFEVQDIALLDLIKI